MNFTQRMVSIILVLCFSSTSFALNHNQENALESYEFIKEVREHASARDSSFTNEEMLEIGRMTALSILAASASLKIIESIFSSNPRKLYLISLSVGYLVILAALAILTVPQSEFGDGTLGYTFLESQERLQELFNLDLQYAQDMIISSPDLQAALQNMATLFPNKNHFPDCADLSQDSYIEILNTHLHQFNIYSNSEVLQETDDLVSLVESNIKYYYETIKSECLKSKTDFPYEEYF